MSTEARVCLRINTYDELTLLKWWRLSGVIKRRGAMHPGLGAVNKWGRLIGAITALCCAAE